MKQTIFKAALICAFSIGSLIGNATKITSEQQLDTILKQNPIVVAKVSAPWCPACVRSEKPFEQTAQELSNAVFVTIDFDSNQAIAKKYNVEGLPTFLFFHNGTVAKRETGASDALKRQIKDIIASFSSGAPAPTTQPVNQNEQVKKNEQEQAAADQLPQEPVKAVETAAGQTRSFFEQAYDSVVQFFNSVADTISSWFK